MCNVKIYLRLRLIVHSVWLRRKFGIILNATFHVVFGNLRWKISSGGFSSCIFAAIKGSLQADLFTKKSRSVRVCLFVCFVYFYFFSLLSFRN